MKHKKLTITFLALAVFAVGCKPSREQSTTQQLENVSQEAKAAAQDLKDYTYAQKDAFVQTMQGQLAQINRDLDQLSAQVERSNEAAKAEVQPKLQALREQLASLNKRLDEAKGATESTWDDVKASFKKGYSELQDGFQQARQWVSDKIEP